ncbi:TIGR03857 family LLM class F420-dependent oxidoreductase [Streptomyces sp. NBC_00564]|uniref:TIGR03857 family LLM class F420-dependent oxidoreductase n=1 Tax=unclassified Streptomyces TaxID=2593676 RepID=UPI002FCDA236|nr:TIGR03857 family LLM class F420-dependent oxidoreductase [Streptomyces sp. NBC_00564]WUC47110.1 TIGR03857 family LLM class F420-dependent oxidoreductase [Streptomyces sp. NBC_00554]
MKTTDTTDPARLGAYVLPGRVQDPRPAVGEARTAEHLGLGSVWISERWGTKDLAVLAGAIGQATDTIRIASGITHFLVRHPAVLASTAMTLQALTGGRFTLGVGRSTDALWKAAGLPRMSNAVLTDSADIFRRLCRGERVSYDGPAGRFPHLRLGDLPSDVPVPPVLLAAIGPKTLALAGRHFDGAILHPFLTPEAVARSAALVRKAAEEAGRDPAAVRIHAEVVTAPDLTEDEENAVVGARAVTYFQIPFFGETLAGANGWDTAELEKLRTHPKLAGLRGAADNRFTRHELLDVVGSLPPEWLATASAAGPAAACADRLRAYLDAGADELILHGSTPDLLGPLVQHFTSAA